jgi:hypothetical protein
VRFAVKVNGELQDFFSPTRGLRQGDPISPYLFLICGEGRTSLLNRYGAYVDRGIRVSARSPWVNHLLLADDSLIFMTARAESADKLNSILNIYVDCSGQKVNKQKSYIYFSPNAMHPLKDVIKNLLGISVEAFTEQYLGLPTAVGRITSGTFDHIGERSPGKMNGWSEKFLSCAAKEILIKVIIQAIPLYSMSCFKLTKKVIKC